MRAHREVNIALLILVCFFLSGCAELGIPSAKVPHGFAGEEEQTIFLSEDQIQTERLSGQSIQIAWSDALDREVETYLVKRCELSRTGQVGKWSVVGEVASDGVPEGVPVRFTDVLSDGAIKQFVYVIDLEIRDGAEYSGGQSQPVLASNLMVCIDPGHYSGVNQIAGEYTEGDAVLELGRILKADLKETYGIDSCMTRTDGTISLHGYSNESLDTAHLSFRGRYAGERDCDLFVSLHTNANEANANGYPTFSQPIAINKPILILNTIACTSQTVLDATNAVGKNLSQVNVQSGVGSVAEFKAAVPSRIDQWTEEYNDGVGLPGTVFCRLDGEGRDYYGVLRGAADAGVPGMIIEHGMHTVPEVRKAVAEGDLLMRWAEADAQGIAWGFGFLAYAEMP